MTLLRPIPLTLALALTLAGPMSHHGVPVSEAGPASEGAAQRRGPRFVDATETWGLDFVHDGGGVGDKQLPETMGSGVAWLDYDRDGRADLYFVDSGPLPMGDASLAASAGATASRPDGRRTPGANLLLRHAAGSGFAAAAAAGADDPGYGMGVSAADFDNDGFPDIFVANVGANRLLRNNGDGTFSDVTEHAGVGDTRWAVSSAWSDLDGDGFTELYVANYIVYDLDNPLVCGRLEQALRSYCHISLFDGDTDLLYRNRADGVFADVTGDAGVSNAMDGKGLGVAIGDVDGDGRDDIYVANDTARNFLYMNRGDLRFEDEGLISGVGFSEDGKAQAGMGVDLADVDGDLELDIVVTNFSFEPVNLYRLMGPGAYFDDTYPLGLGEASLPMLGFGAALVDLDADGDNDMVFANGHILDNVEATQDNTTYAQRNQMFVNRLTELRSAAAADGMLGPDWRPSSGLVRDATAETGEPFQAARVSRGLAFGDGNGDGKPDLAFNNSHDRAEVLDNVTPAAGNKLVVRLRGRHVNRDALGAKVKITPVLMPPQEAAPGRPVVRAMSGFPQLFLVKSGGSYASQNSTDLFAGLAGAERARVEISWPGGETETIDDLEAGFEYVVTEGRGVTAHRPLATDAR